jgi:hypothetical protein
MIVKAFAAGAVVVGATVVMISPFQGLSRPGADPTTTAAVGVPARSSSFGLRTAAPADVSDQALTAVIQRNCVICHNDQLLTGNLSLQTFDVAQAAEMAPTAEKIVTKLLLGMMPPPGVPRPAGDTLEALRAALESKLDRAAAGRRAPGTRPFQRLNRAEYTASVRELLGIDIDPEVYLPPDTKSENFDNIADVQMPSATVMEAYLNVASEIGRMVLGDPKVGPTSTSYKVSRLESQTEQVEGAPVGTRGGISVMHTFPADGEYVFTMDFQDIPTGELFGRRAPFDEQIEVSIDGERVALLDVDRWMTSSDPNGNAVITDPIPVRAGAHRVSAAFPRLYEGPVHDGLAPIGHSIADTQIGDERGTTHFAHLRELSIAGPHGVTGVSETPARRRLLTCRPTSPSEGRACVESIVTRLAAQAYRRPLSDRDVANLMGLYEEEAAEGGFEAGVRGALEGILTSPHFLFRFEEPAGKVKPGEPYRISDLALASRLSFFLWGGPPDRELIRAAEARDLSKPDALERQVRRMLADPRSEALARRFAAQWLRLDDMDKIQPDYQMYPDLDRQLVVAMRRETEAFFDGLVRDDRSVLDLLTADYSYLNADLAEHYGIDGVVGDDFRRIGFSDDRRRGLLGQGSILLLTSHTDRTSPVLRGKWVMEVLLNSPPPPPPPSVPSLEVTAAVQNGRTLTVKERMEMHRASPVCTSCHQYIDPLGLALENYDVIGAWRVKDSGNPVDATGTLWDGTVLSGPADLRQALLKYRAAFLRTFANNLLAYAVGRRVEYSDQPTVRAITERASRNDYRISSFIIEVVKSDAFQMKAPAAEVSQARLGGN